MWVAAIGDRSCARREEGGGAWEKGIKREAGDGGEEEVDRKERGERRGARPTTQEG